MQVKEILPIIGFAISVGMLAPDAIAATADPLIEGSKQCTHLLPQYEKQYNIPKHLLSAIATTESGRYHDGLKLSIPWPWTVNAEGKSYYFDSKREAVAAVRKMQKQGKQSIDVGCMQVNLHHHAQAFPSLEEAFEPKNNIAYAASFLNDLYQEEKSWKRAAANYHSKTPDRGRLYIGRVYNSWSRLVEKLKLAQLKVPESAVAEMRRMKPLASSPGVKYASLSPSAAPPVRKVAPLPEQAGKKVNAYRSPHFKNISISKPGTRTENGVLIVQPEIQSAAVMPAVADTSILRLEAQPVAVRQAGPNFIFND